VFTQPAELQAQLSEVEALLEHWVERQNASARLQDSMRYSLLSGGKRFRPMLALASALLIDAERTHTQSDLKPSAEFSKAAQAVACSVECIHAYSLIHDDLPAMDDDDLRRGQPTNHIRFDEATAILAGDALQTLGFQILSDLPALFPIGDLVGELAQASGAAGMVAGQMNDLLAEGQTQELALTELEAIHRNKTGALIRASVRMGAIVGGASDDKLEALTSYAEALGLAFQIQDDVLDVISDSETLGKTQGADIAKDKSTYVSVLGLDTAADLARDMSLQAKNALAIFDASADYMRSLADYVVQRRH